MDLNIPINKKSENVTNRTKFFVSADRIWDMLYAQIQRVG